MDTLHDRRRTRGVAPWVLWAAIPVVLALGFVSGMAIAVYAPGRAPISSPPPTTTKSPPGQNAATPAPSTPVTPDAAWRIVTASPATADGAEPGRLPGEPQFEKGGPAPAGFTGPATTLSEARQALAAAYGTFAKAGISFRVEYQAMRQTSATGVSLVGMISTADYPQWEKVLREHPELLKDWLGDAAARVQGVSAKEGFHLAWAVVDVVDTRPPGYADQELTALENDTYLVVRRLAATEEPGRTVISLRSLPSLQEAAANRPVTLASSWATYGPAIRFDGDDIYRPIRTTGVNPKRR